MDSTTTKSCGDSAKSADQGVPFQVANSELTNNMNVQNRSQKNLVNLQFSEVSSSTKEQPIHRKSSRLSKQLKRKLLEDSFSDSEAEDSFCASGSEYQPSEAFGMKPIIANEKTYDNTDCYYNTDTFTNLESAGQPVGDLNEGRYNANAVSNVTKSIADFPASYSNANFSLKISTTKKVDGKRLRDKRHCCYFCEKILTNNMARHFQLIHHKEMEVARLLSFPKNSVPRKNGLLDLIKAGDFYYNCNALATKTGELILVRRPNDNNIPLRYADFAPCTHCLGFMTKKYLWRHIKHCEKNGAKNVKCGRGPLAESSALLFGLVGPATTNIEFCTKVLGSIRDDEIGRLLKEDLLILKAGEFMYDSTKGHLESTRQGMRQLTRLKVELNNMQSDTEEKKNLADWLTPKYFDNIVQATKSISRDDNTLDKKVPSLALKIGHLLRMCIKVETGIAIKKSLSKRRQELREFDELMDTEWHIKVSANSPSTLFKIKFNSTQLLPLTSDLIKLSLYLRQQLCIFKRHVVEQCTRQSWSSLASVTLSRIILFNKRCPGEAARMTLTNYKQRPSWAEQGTKEFKNLLSHLERELANRLTIIEIMGKRGKKVPVILTGDVKACIDVLIEKRSAADVAPTNEYIFARSQASESHLRGHDCLRKACSEAGLTSAENICSTKLRKYIATVCQIFDLKENECDWLANHLGHDIRVHRNFYRLHESAAELTKVSRLLIAVDNGDAQKFSGRQLSDINVEELPPLEIDENDPVNDQISDVETLVENNPLEGSQPKGQNMKSIQNKRIPVVKTKWTTENSEHVLKEFKAKIKVAILPSKKDCEDCIKKYPSLKNRKWTDIKFFVKNYLKIIVKRP